MWDASEAEFCPCGEALEGPRGAHVLCNKHRRRVEQDVTRRLGPHRYGGRYAHEVEDVVHSFYEKLLSPGALDRFEVELGRTRADAFGGWLWRVVTNHCHNKLKEFVRQSGASLEGAPEPGHLLTPEQAFARRAIVEHASSAVATVEANWKATGAEKSLRFDAFIGLVLGEKGSYETIRRLLGLGESNARRVRSDLGEAVRLEVRRRVRDTLSFEPGLTRQDIEQRIDQEIEELLITAFPEDSEPSASLTSEVETREPIA